MFGVVEFPGSESSGNELAIVPLVWIYKNDRRCYWPTSSGGRTIKNFIKRQTAPEKSWPSYEVVKVHFKSASYESADEFLIDLLKDNALEVEESNGTMASLTRKNYDYDTRQEQCDDETNVLSRSDTALLTSEVGTSLATNSSASHTSEQTSRAGTPASVIPASDEVGRSLTANSSPIHTPESTPRVGTPASTHHTPTIMKTAHVYTPPASDASTVTIDSEHEMVSTLSKLAAHVEQHTIMLHELIRLARKSDQQLHLTAPLGLPKFPINSLEEFETFNGSLEDEAISEYLIGRLAAVGGASLESLTRRILKFLITDEVALNYNWKGRDKKSFESTKIMSIIYEAVKRNFPAGERNDLLVANTCKEWLKHSKTRLNQKKRSRADKN